MKDNYLLHNDTAKKLYWDYAKDLPVIALCSDPSPSDKIYNNVAEAFLLNDTFKLQAMREYGIDEKYITGDASDYEKFKAFCSILLDYAGNSIYLLSHIEIRYNFQCFIDISLETCDEIWAYCNEYIINNRITEKYLTEKANVTAVGCLEIDTFLSSLYLRRDIEDLGMLENIIKQEISKAYKNGIKNAILTLGDDFFKPNSYAASEVYKKLLLRQSELTYEEFRLLSIQLIRDMGIYCKDLSWNWLYEYYEPSHELLTYLEKNNALPSINPIYLFNVFDTEDEVELDIRNISVRSCLGKTICTVDFSSIESAYARNDYLRRVICNLIGKWVENGEYSSNEKVLKKLIEDVLYKNIKEAIK